ncbi:MAG: recombinase family protein [Verrucomicrobia bacterium]|nr:recombinase family protein [Verrucomicrobiota bacterium]
MRVAIYSRVSTDKQSHDSQLVELRAYCRQRGWPNAGEYLDQASGAKFSRAGLDRLMADVRRGRLDLVACYKLDRLGRSLAHLAQIVSEFSSHRVALICTSQGIDTSDDNPAGRLQLGVLMAVAEFERSIIRERVNAGLRAAKARGVKLGRPTSHSHHKDAAERLLAQGKGVREISRTLGMPLASASRLIARIRRAGSP